MNLTKDKKKGTWLVQFYYTDWQGVRKKKLKRGFRTKAEAEAWVIDNYGKQIISNEIRSLRQKLNQAYEFMKQFTIGGINMLEKFLQSIGERVQQMVAGLGR